MELQKIQTKIYTIRGFQVMTDSDLAVLYQVETKNLNKAVNRNIERFPPKFRFQLTFEEWENLRFQFGTSSDRHGGVRYLPYVFSEQGVAMLSSVLRSETAVNAADFQSFYRFVLLPLECFQKGDPLLKCWPILAWHWWVQKALPFGSF